MAGLSMAIVSIVTFAVDWNRKCKDPAVWIWQIGFLSITVLDVTCRFWVVRNATSYLHELENTRHELDSDKEEHRAEGGFLGYFSGFQSGMSHYFDGFFKYTVLTESWPYFFAKILTVLAWIWGGV